MIGTRQLRWSVPFPLDGKRTDEDNGKSAALALGCRLVEMSGIPNDAAAREYLFRAYALTLVGAPDFLGISYTDILANIGLRTNVIKAARPAFIANLARYVASTASERIPIFTERGLLPLEAIGWDGQIVDVMETAT